MCNFDTSEVIFICHLFLFVTSLMTWPFCVFPKCFNLSLLCISQERWQEGLAVLDKALHHMPRTSHRLLLFKHRVIVKAKLGKDVSMDIAKFKVSLLPQSNIYFIRYFHQYVCVLNFDYSSFRDITSNVPQNGPFFPLKKS